MRKKIKNTKSRIAEIYVQYQGKGDRRSYGTIKIIS